MAPAVGALISAMTFSLAPLQASTIASLCIWPYSDGTVTQASMTLRPSFRSAERRREERSMATRSSGRKNCSCPLVETLNSGLSSSPRTICDGQNLLYHRTQGLSILKPMSRCGAKMVFSMFETACSRASSPTNTPASVKASQQGIDTFPFSFAMIETSPPCQTPTRAYVVPRSMPRAGASPGGSALNGGSEPAESWAARRACRGDSEPDDPRDLTLASCVWCPSPKSPRGALPDEEGRLSLQRIHGPLTGATSGGRAAVL
mmetsp:Transcript_6097/g.19528  ORF Transcript_6097/g.19528 Transcript_6097/m.19528 type:complete len:261 (+) Transcript_6097:966-1748(+)